jgi:hypothetical protein
MWPGHLVVAIHGSDYPAVAKHVTWENTTFTTHLPAPSDVDMHFFIWKPNCGYIFLNTVPRCCHIWDLNSHWLPYIWSEYSTVAFHVICIPTIHVANYSDVACIFFSENPAVAIPEIWILNIYQTCYLNTQLLQYIWSEYPNVCHTSNLNPQLFLYMWSVY